MHAICGYKGRGGRERSGGGGYSHSSQCEAITGQRSRVAGEVEGRAAERSEGASGGAKRRSERLSVPQWQQWLCGSMVITTRGNAHALLMLIASGGAQRRDGRLSVPPGTPGSGNLIAFYIDFYIFLYCNGNLIAFYIVIW